MGHKMTNKQSLISVVLNLLTVQVCWSQNNLMPVTGSNNVNSPSNIQANATSLTPPINITATATTTTNTTTGPSELEAFNKFRNIYKLSCFEEDVLSIPIGHATFIRELVVRDSELFRTIIKEAIEKKNNFAPSVKLMLKYSGKLLTTFIKNKAAEKKINPRKEPKPAFFNMLANLAENVLDKSVDIKKEKEYSKKTVNTDLMYQRFDKLLNYIKRVTDISPVGAYLKWDEAILYKDEDPSKEISLIDEISDLSAQFRGMGYDSAMFVVRRIVNLLRMFGKGLSPTENDV